MHTAHHTGAVQGPEGTLEIWSAGGDESYVYTTSRPVMQALRRRFGQGTEYIRNGVTLAWQFKIPRRFVAFLKRSFRAVGRGHQALPLEGMSPQP